MLKPDQIPDEVVEALQQCLNGCDCDECLAVCIAAAINAWPGMLTERRARCDAVVLPFNLDADIGVIALPTENTNAET